MNGTLDIFDGNNIFADALTGSGTVTMGDISWSTINKSITVGVNGGGGTFTGTISDSGDDTVSLIKTGGGTQILTGTSNYHGTTTVNGGSLVVNGNIATSSLTTVQSGGTLGGSGTVGSLTVASGGSLNPGNSPGILSVDGDYNQAGTLNIEIAGLTAGSQHDQVNVDLTTGDLDGTVSLSGSLDTAFSGGSYVNGNLLFIVLNDGSDAINGTFSGLAQDAIITHYGGFDWKISYTADSTGSTFTGGNDVALMAVPELSATGTWNTTTNGALWTLDTNWVGNVIAGGAGKTADFNQVDITADTAVDLNGIRTIGNLIFGDTNTSTGGSWILDGGGGGGALILAGGAPTITVNAMATNQAVTMNAGLSGTSGFTKNGTGTLYLAGGTSNTLSGPITVSAGYLGSMNSADLQNMTGDITVASGATFDAKAGFGAGIANNFILSGTGGGYFGALNIRENASLTGAITLAADSLITHDWNTAWVNGSITGTHTNLELKTLQASQYGFSMGGPISLGTGALTLTGIGTIPTADFNFYGTNSYTGGTLLKGGRVTINNASALGSGTVTFVSDTSLTTTATMTQANALTVNSGVAATLGADASTTLYQSGAVTGNGTLTKSGLGTVILSGGLANTFTGPITASAGRLGLQDSVSLQNMTGAITVASGATFNANASFGPNITNNFVLSGTGDGIDASGALNIRGNANLTGAITLAADTKITHDWNIASVSASITGTNTNLELQTLVNSQYGFFMGGPISLGTGSLTLNGIGTAGSADLTLYGANSWGAMVIEKGVVVFNNTAAMGGTGANITIGTDGVAILNGAPISTLLSRVNTASTGAISFSSSSTDNIDLTNHPSLSVGSQVNMVLSGAITPGGGFYRLGGGGKTLTVSSTLSGSSGLIVNDAQGGTLVLSGGHTYTGSTTVTAGTLQVDGSLSGAVSVAAAGTLAPGPASGIGSLTLASPLTVNGKLSFRIDRSNSQNADLITAPSLALTGVLSVNNIGPALQAGDSFKLFDISGGFTPSQVTFSLPTLSNGLMWDGGSLLTTGTLKVAAVNSSPVGDAAWPGLLLHQIQAAKQAGNASVTINPGIYQLLDKDAWDVTFDLNGWTNFTIDATGVTLVVGKQRAFQLTNCNNVTIKGCTIRARYPSFTQGRVLSKGVNPDGTVFAIWKVSDGYPTTFSSFIFNAVNQADKTINLGAGDCYRATVADLGANTWKVTFPSEFTSLGFSEGDWLVARLNSGDGQNHAVRLDNSTNCTLQSLTSQGGGFASVFEAGGGGNRLWGYRIECSPDAPVGGTETPVVSSGADGVHTVATYPGLDIKDCVFTGVFLDDCIAIHGYFNTVLSASGNTVTMNGYGYFVVGEPVRISDTAGFFAQATCTAVANLGNGTVQVTLDQTLAVPVGAKASSPKFNGSGFRITNCQFGNTRSRAIITKADDGLISGCTISNSNIAINIGPEFYWDESDYSWNNTVVGNLISDCFVGVNLVQNGAIGNRNLSVIDNSFSSITRGNCISIGGCDGATISGNSFPTPTAAETILLYSSTNITLANNLVAYAPGGIGVLNIGSNVTSVQGAANGMLYSGRPYALSNSLSGLLLAHPSSNAVGTTLQQYSNGNPSSRWILQPDGNGHCKIVSAATGLVVGVNQSSSSAAPLILETSGPGQGQRWTLTPVGTSAIKLVNQLSGFAATVQTASLAETVTQLANTSAAGQLWTPAPDDRPVATAQDVTTPEDTAKPITLAGNNLQGGSLTYTIVTQPASGTLSGTPPNLTYTPNANFNGADGFTFKVNDGSLDSPPATVSITVTAVNDVPVFAINPFATAGATESLAYTGQTLAGKATDADAGYTISYSKVSGPAWLAVASNGTLSGTPSIGSAGLNTFSVRATDSAAATADATLQITVTAQPLPLPWLKGDIGTGMLAGSLTYNAGTFTQAGSGVIGSTSDNLNFTYQTLTGDGELIARISVLQDTGTSSRVGVMIRDTLAANSMHIFMGMTGTNAYRWVRRTTTGGTTTSSNSSTGTVPNTWVRLVRADTTITAYKSRNGTSWTQVGSTTGTTSNSTCYIGLAVSSGSTTTLNNSQFSNVTITQSNTAPMTNAQNASTAEDIAKVITLAGTDGQGDPLTYTVLTQPANGTLSGTEPDLTYTPAANYHGSDSFTFKVNDGLLDSAPATVSLTVTSVNDTPVANTNSGTVAEDGTVNITLTGSDADPLDTLGFAIVAQPTNGTVTLLGAVATYTPAANYHGGDSFTFKVSDGTVDSAAATVSLTVTSVNDAPGFANDPIDGTDATQSLAYTGQTLAGKATDADAGDTITYSKISGPAWLAVAPNGTLSGTPPIGSAGLNTFSVRATDSAAATVDATLRITVLSDYQSWAGNFPGYNLTDPAGDADSDGLPNQEEWIWGLDPTSGSSVNASPTMVNFAAKSFRYTRRDDALTGLDYSIWYSTNFESWLKDAGAIQVAGIPNEKNVETVEFTLSPHLQVQPKLFLRVQASEGSGSQ